MSTRIFKQIPWKNILRRSIGPAIAAYLIGFMLMGVLAVKPYFLKKAETHVPISPIPFAVSGSAFEAASLHHRLVWYYLNHTPEVCSGESVAVNDFQRAQCSAFWDRVTTLGALAFLPFALAGVLLFFVFDLASMRYKKAHTLIRGGKAQSIAVVTEPAIAPGDFYSWLLCLQTITVEVSPGKQLRVYLPWDESIPTPGSRFAVFNWGETFGAKRYAGILYAPHISVVQGS